MNPHNNHLYIDRNITITKIESLTDTDNESLNFNKRLIEQMKYVTSKDACEIVTFINMEKKEEIGDSDYILLAIKWANEFNDLSNILNDSINMTHLILYNQKAKERYLVTEVKCRACLSLGKKQETTPIYAKFAEIKNNMLKITDIYDIVYNIPIDSNKSN